MEIKKLKTDEFDRYSNINSWICNLALQIETDDELIFILGYNIFNLEGKHLSDTLLTEIWEVDEEKGLIFNTVKKIE